MNDLFQIIRSGNYEEFTSKLSLIDVNVKDKYGNNPLWTAVFNENYQIVQLYVDNNGDINNKNGNNMSPLDFAIELADTTLIEILTLKNNRSHT